jgi:hypothetical protein
VPAPATLRILEGHPIRPGPPDSGELVTPTGAALVKVLSAGPPPAEYVPLRSGFGAGTKELADRANALRIVLAELDVPASDGRENLMMLACDVDDMSPEYLAAVADHAREAGAFDVVIAPLIMKKGRPGSRIEILCSLDSAAQLEQLLLVESSTLGVRQWPVRRRALPREARSVDVLGQRIAVKLVTLPDGNRRAKPEFEDVRRASQATGRSVSDIFKLASAEAERL